MSNEHKVIFEDLGKIEYAKAWDYQKKLMQQAQELRQTNNDLPVCEQLPVFSYLLFCEHPHVYTLGKSGKDQNLLVNEQFLKQKGASFFKIDRGGDITYHGPGQIVGYPIFNLEILGLGVKQYVAKLEEAVILTLDKFGISGSRLSGATGVWLDVDKPGKIRKICAIGVKVSRTITMHGFAFNVNTNLDYFSYINPCGFVDKGVTSMEQELGETFDIEEVKAILNLELAKVFGYAYEKLD